MSDAASRRDERIDHIATTKAKLTDQDSLKLFGAFLAGDMVGPLAEIVSRRVDETTVELRAQLQAGFDQRLDDIRAEAQRQVAGQVRRLLAEQLSEALAAHREEWASYLANWDGAVLPPDAERPSITGAIRALRGPVPFGRAAGPRS